MVTTSAIPYADIKVSLEKSIDTDEKKTDKSTGMTLKAGEVATISLASPTGVLGFTCAAEVKGTELKYKLDGTDKKVFSLSSATVAVTAVKPGEKPSAPALTLTNTADSSTPSKTVMAGTCPGLGTAWIEFAPAGATTLTKVADVKAAYTAYDATASDRHTKSQWCRAVVVDKTKATTCNFRSASKTKYVASLYCETIEGWFFSSAKQTAVTSKDNGG